MKMFTVKFHKRIKKNKRHRALLEAFLNHKSLQNKIFKLIMNKWCKRAIKEWETK